MLIGFMGAGGVGKTTTAKAVASATGLEFRASSSRAVFERRNLVEADQAVMTAQQQWDLQAEIFEERCRFEQTFTDGVCDRTLLDQLCYALLRAHPVMHDDVYGLYKSMAVESLRRYDHLFYFPLVNFTKEPDMRDSTYGSRFVFDSIMRRLITLYVPRLVHVPVQTVEARTMMIVHRIEIGDR